MTFRSTAVALVVTASLAAGVPAAASTRGESRSDRARPSREQLAQPDPLVARYAVEPSTPDVEAQVAHLAEEFRAITGWINAVNKAKAKEAARQAAEAERAKSQQRRSSVASSRSVAVTPSAGGHDPCAEPISGLLPNYIVQRESHGQCGAYNHGGCGGRGCLGWAQIDEGHFYADSPWGSGPGSCYGLSYNGCVSKLSNGGTNLAPWKCC